MGFWSKLFGRDNVVATSSTYNDLTQTYDPTWYTGEKYPGGLSPVVELVELDYWSIRQRSNELFFKNAYARGIVRRITTNIITTGLHLEATPDESIIGVPEDSLLDWAEDVENRFFLYNETPQICDVKGRRTGGELQQQAITEALVGGDCLLVLRQSPKYKLPMMQIISGDRIQTPASKIQDPNIIDGVEIGKNGRHIAYYVVTDSNGYSYTRIPAYGKNTGRHQAKMIYGVDKREDGVRGEPLLSIAIQPLAEIDKYRDSAQRKAVLNSLVVAAIERGPNNKRQTKPLSGGGAAKRGTVDVYDNSSGENKRVSMADLIPGINFENLQPDEKINFFNNNGVDTNFGAFEASIVAGLAWALEIPPEILLLSFNSNYSASQAALNEFKIYLNKERKRFGSGYCDFLYQDWFLSMVLMNKITADSYLRDIGTPMNWDRARAWTLADWSGAMKPSTDMLKTANAYKLQCEEGFNTRERSCREISGQKYSKVIRRLQKENEMLATAMRPMLQLEQDFGQGSVDAMRTNFKIVAEAEESEAV